MTSSESCSTSCDKHCCSSLPAVWHGRDLCRAATQRGVLHRHLHWGAPLWGDSPSLYPKEPTQSEACVTLPGHGTCGFDQHQPQEGAGVPWTDLQHTWQVLEPQGFHMTWDDVHSASSWAFHKKRTICCQQVAKTYCCVAFRRHTLSRKKHPSHRVVSW